MVYKGKDDKSDAGCKGIRQIGACMHVLLSKYRWIIHKVGELQLELHTPCDHESNLL